VIVLSAAALSQGIGLLLLIPILEVAGVGSVRSSGAAGLVRSAVEAVGIPLTLGALLVVYVGVVAVAAALGAYQTVLVTRYRLEFVDDLRGRLYAAVARADWRHLLGLRQSDLLATLTVSVGWVGQGTLAVLKLATAAFVIAVQVAVAIRISPAITALAAATGALLTGLVWPLARRSRRLGGELVDSNKQVMGTVTGFLDGLKLAKAHGLEAGHVTTFDQAVRRTRRAQIEFARAQAVAAAVQLVVTALVLAILVWVAVERLQVPLAGLLVLAFIFMQLVPQMIAAQQNVQFVAQSLPSFEELLAVIESCEAAGEATAPVPAAGRRRVAIGSGVRLENVSFTYPGGAMALRDVSLEIASRRVTALVGPSGAGKTTLADLAVGLLRPSSGTVLVGGRPLAEGDLPGWRAVVGMIPQDPFLFHDTIRANLLWASADAEDADLWAALDLAAASGLVSSLPAGLESVVGDRGSLLSGGERQRIALARGLLRQPELLVLDEATSSLDTENELAVRDALTELRGRLTMLVIAHRLSTVSHADTIAVLDAGRLVECGPWTDLSARERGRFRLLIEAGAPG
jgi:ATP-binding cassette subfamily C protein